MINEGLANLSNQLMLGTVLVYVTAMVGYAADLAFGRKAQAKAEAEAAVKEASLATVGSPSDAEARGELWTEERAQGAPATEHATREELAPKRAGAEGGNQHRQIHWGRFAVLMTVIGWGLHLGEIVTRGLAAERWPWGNMYEFASAICFAAVTAYLILLWRWRSGAGGWLDQPIRFLGAFVMLAANVGLGVATIWLYNDPGPLQPALNSYWIAIHVSAAITATGTFAVAAVANILHLLVDRRERGQRVPGFVAGLPGTETLDRITHRTIMFGFPIWTFAIVAGAIWADEAWGRYWGWDPKETWSFITWVVYAGYLHARTTAGWRGRRAAIVALVAFGCLLFNFFGINFLVSGMHSYA